MTLPSLLKDYAAFNRWANRQFTDWLSSLPAELLDREVPSSFPSLRLTVLHLWDAETIWINRLRGISLASFPSRSFDGTPEELFRGLLETSEAFRNLVQSQSDAFFGEETAFTLFNGTPDRQNNAQILLHVFQHASFHRGQLITIGRSLGLTDPPKTDYIHYVRLEAVEGSVKP
jgi:uncharacterized damage-inducible protein DinB